MKIELKNLKVAKFASEETTCFQAVVYIDGKKAATAKNDGRGGCTMFYFEDHALEQKFYDYCKSLPPHKSKYGELTMNAEFYISLLVEEEEARKWYVRRCKKETLFRLRNDPVKEEEMTWRILKNPYTPAVKDWLVKKYGDELGEIANETRL